MGDTAPHCVPWVVLPVVAVTCSGLDTLFTVCVLALEHCLGTDMVPAPFQAACHLLASLLDLHVRYWLWLRRVCVCVSTHSFARSQVYACYRLRPRVRVCKVSPCV
jgi:hypothetical protein